MIGLACDLRDQPAASHHSASAAAESGAGSDSGSGLGASSSKGGSIWVSLNGDFSPPYGQLFNLPPGLSGLHAAFTGKYTWVRCSLAQGANWWRFPPPDPGFQRMAAFRSDTAGAAPSP